MEGLRSLYFPPGYAALPHRHKSSDTSKTRSLINWLSQIFCHNDGKLTNTARAQVWSSAPQKSKTNKNWLILHKQFKLCRLTYLAPLKSRQRVKGKKVTGTNYSFFFKSPHIWAYSKMLFLKLFLGDCGNL